MYFWGMKTYLEAYDVIAESAIISDSGSVDNYEECVKTLKACIKPSIFIEMPPFQEQKRAEMLADVFGKLAETCKDRLFFSGSVECVDGCRELYELYPSNEHIAGQLLRCTAGFYHVAEKEWQCGRKFFLDDTNFYMEDVSLIAGKFPGNTFIRQQTTLCMHILVRFFDIDDSGYEDDNDVFKFFRELWVRIALHNRDSEIRCCAVYKLTDQNVLKQLALHDKDAYVRRAAVRNLNDAETLLQVALFDPNGRDVCYAGYDGFGEDIYIDVRKEAAYQLDLPKDMIDAARYHQDERIRLEALKKWIDDEETLIYAALNDVCAENRLVAVAKLSDQETLIRVSLNDKSGKFVPVPQKELRMRKP